MGLADGMCFLEGLLWLSLNIYHEARGEPELAQLAVAHVTLNRSLQKKANIGQVVFAPYQFSWTAHPQAYLPTDRDAFAHCLQTAFTAMITPDFTHGATFFHHQDIAPSWSKKLTYVGRWGHHKFYRIPDKAKAAGLAAKPIETPSR